MKVNKKDYQEADFDYNKIAEEFTEFKTENHKSEAHDEVIGYINNVSSIDCNYAVELLTRFKKDNIFRTQMLNSVIQLSTLLTATCIESIFKFDIILEVVKRKSLSDFEDVTKFKINLLENFTINDYQEILGLEFTDDTVKLGDERLIELRKYFKNKVGE